MKTKFDKQIEDSISLKNSIKKLEKNVNKVILNVVSKLKKGGKVMLCGNGGSAADAQHLAAEFLVRLRPNFNRKPLPAITLALDSSTLTACGNDYSYHDIFSRNLQALGQKNDILIVISTSGNSKNIINVLKKAKQMKIFSVGLLGKLGGKAKKYCNLPIIVPSNNTARIQETHIFLGHFIMESVEDILFKNIRK